MHTMNQRVITLAAVAILAASAYAQAPAPYPIRINSRELQAPAVAVFRANERTFRATFTDGVTASDVSGCVPFMAWATNSTSASVSTSSWAFVSAGTNGVVDFKFSPSAVNHAPGRYGYEIGVAASNGTARTYAQGSFVIQGSPTGAGAAAVNWTTRVDWNAVDWINLPAVFTNYLQAVESSPGVYQLYQVTE